MPSNTITAPVLRLVPQRPIVNLLLTNSFLNCPAEDRHALWEGALALFATTGRMASCVRGYQWFRRCLLGTATAGAVIAAGAAVASAAAEPPPWAQSARLPPETSQKHAHRVPPGLKDGRCRPEMFKASKVAGLGNAARRSLSAPRRKGVSRRTEPMDGTALGALMAAIGTGNRNPVLSRRETVCFSQSFEHVPDRKTVAWSDRKLAVYYSVMPLRTLRTSDGHVCREYTAKATVNGHAADVYGTACRDSEGRWLLID